ncbi:MAG: leucine-rich repeat-containing protein kinase family protein [Gallionella sp.]
MDDTIASIRAGKLYGTKRLDLSCGLAEFPDEIFELADSLEILNLSGNRLSKLPADLHRLHKLRVIFCSNNHFTELPKALGHCANLEIVGFKANRIHHVPRDSLPKKLRWLILTDNQISELPREIGTCNRLQKLMLAGNQLNDLPAQMVGCTRLELLRIAANRFDRLPEWLLTMPRLAWLAYSGNPFSDALAATALSENRHDQIDWYGLSMQNVLGQGASGVIYRADLKTDSDPLPVAVKLFKGAITSDGLPRSEKAASLAAGAHPALIPVTGKLRGHPENKAGLVMSLVSSDYVNLAGPPSLESCTRDIYPSDAGFTLASVITIAISIADVANHLHGQRIMHGDLYAHNILWDDGGRCLLGDFGAASFAPKNDVILANGLQRIEVRAFGCLLEELLDHCHDPCGLDHVVNALRELQYCCEQTEVSQRPLFSEIVAELKLLAATLQV